MPSPRRPAPARSVTARSSSGRSRARCASAPARSARKPFETEPGRIAGFRRSEDAMETQDTLGVESIRGLLERTPADPDVLRALIRRDPAFAAQCRQYRDVEVEIHRLRDRHARIER